jgi:hypothetical protein
VKLPALPHLEKYEGALPDCTWRQKRTRFMIQTEFYYFLFLQSKAFKNTQNLKLVVRIYLDENNNLQSRFQLNCYNKVA